jgi:hypothetical protein
MKNRTYSLLALGYCLALASFGTLNSGCATSAVANQAIATGEVSVGDVYANAKLGAIDSSPAGTAAQKQAVADLTRLGADLNLFVQGKLTQFELGALTTQLQKDQLALSNNVKATDQINSILNIFAQTATAGGYVTPYASLVQGNVTNIVNGLGQAIQYQEGKWSVSNPGVWVAPSSPTTYWRVGNARARLADIRHVLPSEMPELALLANAPYRLAL